MPRARHGVHETGYREVIGLDVGECETEPFSRSFLRGLAGVQLVVSDAHAGLKRAIAKVLGCQWQRCSVHFLRDALGHGRREQQPMLAALLRPPFNAEDGDGARELLGAALDRLRKPLPRVAALLEEIEWSRAIADSSHVQAKRGAPRRARARLIEPETAPSTISWSTRPGSCSPGRLRAATATMSPS